MKTVHLATMEELIGSLNRHTNSFVYRGQASAEWSLESSLERIIGTDWDATKAMRFEEYSLDEFRSRFHLYDTENWTPESKLAWLSTMQHYGVPTRLIDFTTSPYVALYFALESYSPRSGADIAVFALDYSATMETSFVVLRNVDPDFTETRQSHRNKQNKIFDETVDKALESIVWVTEPEKLNKRLDRQSGCFVLSGNRGMRLRDVLDAEDYCEVPFFKYVIPSGMYGSIHALLRKMNINSKTLYGDLSGLGRSIKMELQAYAPN